MHLTLAHIGSRPASSTRSKDGFDALTQFYLDRCSVFARCQMQAFRTEQDFLDWLAKQQGRSYLFSRAGTVWKQAAELKGSDSAAGDFFGYSVAVSADAAVAGADGHAKSAGRAYLFAP